MYNKQAIKPTLCLQVSDLGPLQSQFHIALKLVFHGDFLGGPVAKIPHLQCRGPGFNPSSGN